MTWKEIDYIMHGASSHATPGFDNWPTKFEMFRVISDLLKGKKYWYALRIAHLDSDNRFRYRMAFKKAFKSQQPNRETLMSEKDRKYLQELPEKITIYRGMTVEEFKDGDWGVSWSLKKDVAMYYAQVYGRNYDTKHLKKMVHKLVVNKSEVIAFINSRREFEIIYIHDAR
jgi:hypothetical protein